MPDTRRTQLIRAELAARLAAGGTLAQRRELTYSDPEPANAESLVTRSILRILRGLIVVGLPLVLIVALIVYFGWAFSAVRARTLGLDISWFDYSPQHYFVEALGVLFWPLLFLILVLGTGIAGHRFLRRALGRESTSYRRVVVGRLLQRAMLVSGVTLVGASLSWALWERSATRLWAPLALAAGVSAIFYGSWLSRITAARGLVRDGFSTPGVLLAGAVVALASFWWLSMYADATGRDSVEQLAASVVSMPRATAYSETPLSIQAPGVSEQRLGAGADVNASSGLYRTSGLRFFVRSGGRLFLLHDGWTPREGTVIVISDDDSVRWEFSR